MKTVSPLGRNSSRAIAIGCRWTRLRRRGGAPAQWRTRRRESRSSGFGAEVEFASAEAMDYANVARALSGSGEIPRDLMPEGELFNEERHDERVEERLREDKGGKMRRWLRHLFRRSELEPFAPPPLADSEYVRRADELLRDALGLLAADGWKREKDGPREGDVVEVLTTAAHGKLFRLTAAVDCPAEFLFEELGGKLESIPQWTPTILESKIIRAISAETDLTYQVTAGGGGGAVKPRDFVNVRRKCRVGARFVTVGCSVEYPGFPPTPAYVRGDNVVGCWAMQDRAPSGCTFQWLMGCNLKGWIPQYVIDVAFTTAMLEFLQHLTVFCDKKRAEGAF